MRGERSTIAQTFLESLQHELLRQKHYMHSFGFFLTFEIDNESSLNGFLESVWTGLRIRPQKPRPRVTAGVVSQQVSCHSRCGTIKIPPWSKDIGEAHKLNFQAFFSIGDFTIWPKYSVVLSLSLSYILLTGIRKLDRGYVCILPSHESFLQFPPLVGVKFIVIRSREALPVKHVQLAFKYAWLVMTVDIKILYNFHL